MKSDALLTVQLRSFCVHGSVLVRARLTNTKTNHRWPRRRRSAPQRVLTWELPMPPPRINRRHIREKLCTHGLAALTRHAIRRRDNLSRHMQSCLNDLTNLSHFPHRKESRVHLTPTSPGGIMTKLISKISFGRRASLSQSLACEIWQSICVLHFGIPLARNSNSRLASNGAQPNFLCAR